MENFILFKDGSGMNQTLSLVALDGCKLLKDNLVAPTPVALTTLPHANVETTLHFDHEFAGFTKKLTRETIEVLASGTYTIKIVIQDVADSSIDSATFFEESSLKLYDFPTVDFDLDGDVDGSDFLTWQIGNGMTNPTFQNGDSDGDGNVDYDDLIILASSWGQSGGFANFKQVLIGMAMSTEPTG